MTDITAFVTARLDEDQAAAERGSSGRHSHLHRDNYGCLLADPARVLAQVAAMRAIVDWAEDLERACLDDGIYGIEPDTPLRRLAAIWRDHDDYDPAWAPDTQT